MCSTSEEKPLPIEKIRDILNQWSQRDSLRTRHLGSQIAIKEVTNANCYRLHLRSQLEHRCIHRTTVAYRGETLDSVGPPSGLWEVEGLPPPPTSQVAFVERTDCMKLPGTDKVEECRGCDGVGSRHCPNCQGSGKVTCWKCNGTGWREFTYLRSVGGKFPREERGTRREGCSCSGKMLNCPTCIGKGQITCSTCDGTRQVKHFDQLTVEFQVENKEEVEYEKGPHQDLVLRESGKTLCDQWGSRIEAVEPIHAKVDARIQDLLRSSSDIPADTRLLFQQLTVQRIPVHRISYTYHDNKTRVLWIYGTNNQVYAPGAPWRWGLVLVWIAAGVLGLGVLIALLAWGLTR
jgi:hypothetical protein